jgi:hypothetical protein
MSVRLRTAQCLAGVAAMALLAGCSGGSGAATSPAPPVLAMPAQLLPPPPPPTPTPPPGTNFDTAEYRRSNAAVAAQALAAYNAGATGANVVVAVIDSGIDFTSAEFAGRISGLSRDVVGDRGIGDEDGHGTEVSAILLAARNNSSIHGVAFDATLLALRIDQPGSCATTAGCAFQSNAIAAGLDIATAARARVVNLSLGGPGSTLQLNSAIARATGAGVAIVISAGNDGAAEIDPLARGILGAATPGTVIVAGAIDGNRALASFSNRAGAAANSYLTALGVGVRSFDHRGAAFLYSGTSESAPVISGAIALLASAFPNLSGPQLVDLLLRTADDLGAPGTDSVFGRGALNLARAFAPVGALSVSRVAIPLSLAGAGTLGAAFGDGGAFGAAIGNVAVIDQYDRGYLVDLGASLRREGGGRLAAALIGGDLAWGGAWLGAGSFGFAVAGGATIGWRGDALTGADRRPPDGSLPARIVSGQAVLPVRPGQALAFGFGLPVARLVDAAAGAGGASAVVVPGWAALVTMRQTGDAIGSRDVAAAALAQRLGGWTATLAMGARSLAASAQGGGPIADPARAPGWAGGASATQALLRVERDLGRLHLAVDAGVLQERGALLGSRLAPAFGVNGATTGSAALRLRLPLAGWTIAAAAEIGVVRANLTGNGLVRAADGLTATAASFSIGRDGVLAQGDSFSLTVAQPMRAAGQLLLETGSNSAALARIGPSGRETAFEAGYAWPIGNGLLGLGLFWRDQPGHVAGAAPDAGGAVRWRARF